MKYNRNLWRLCEGSHVFIIIYIVDGPKNYVSRLGRSLTDIKNGFNAFDTFQSGVIARNGR